jgi:epoxyqueuosine reductase QueG
VSLISEAPLEADPLSTEPICLGEKCRLCLDNCPAGAFSSFFDFTLAGRIHKIARIDIDTCRGYYKDSALSEQCGRECMTSCPVGNIP